MKLIDVAFLFTVLFVVCLKGMHVEVRGQLNESWFSLSSMWVPSESSCWLSSSELYHQWAIFCFMIGSSKVWNVTPPLSLFYMGRRGQDTRFCCLG